MVTTIMKSIKKYTRRFLWEICKKGKDKKFSVKKVDATFHGKNKVRLKSLKKSSKKNKIRKKTK